jgi:hypothetical protein
MGPLRRGCEAKNGLGVHSKNRLKAKAVPPALKAVPLLDEYLRDDPAKCSVCTCRFLKCVLFYALLIDHFL